METLFCFSGKKRDGMARTYRYHHMKGYFPALLYHLAQMSVLDTLFEGFVTRYHLLIKKKLEDFFLFSIQVSD